MTTTFRPSVGQAGEPLLVPLDPEHSAARFSEFLAVTGLDPSQVVTSVTSAVPVPLYPDRWPESRRRWHIKPTAMWHPLMWLPERLAHRARLTINGRVEIENDELWSARVLLEMTRHGLYDEDQGWVDILALNGLDIDDPAVQQRVAAWCAGDPDPDLDRIDITGMLEDEPGDDPDWAFHTAWNAVRDLRPVAWVINADYLLRVTDSYLDTPDEFDTDRLIHGADSILALGWFAFWTLPAGLDPEWWRGARATRPTSRDGILQGLLPQARTRLEAIRAAYWDTAMDVVGVGEELADTEAGREVDDPIQW